MSDERRDRLGWPTELPIDLGRALGRPGSRVVLLDRQRLLGVVGQDRRPFGGIEVAGHVLDGPAIELERLAAGGQPGGLTGARQRRVVRLAPQAGALVVDRGVDLRGALEPRPELTGAGMELAPIRRRDRAVQRITQELMPEVVQAAQAWRIEHELVDELLERRLERARAARP